MKTPTVEEAQNHAVWSIYRLIEAKKKKDAGRSYPAMLDRTSFDLPGGNSHEKWDFVLNEIMWGCEVYIEHREEYVNEDRLHRAFRLFGEFFLSIW